MSLFQVAIDFTINTANFLSLISIILSFYLYRQKNKLEAKIKYLQKREQIIFKIFDPILLTEIPKYLYEVKEKGVNKEKYRAFQDQIFELRKSSTILYFMDKIKYEHIRVSLMLIDENAMNLKKEGFNRRYVQKIYDEVEKIYQELDYI